MYVVSVNNESNKLAMAHCIASTVRERRDFSGCRIRLCGVFFACKIRVNIAMVTAI